MQYSEERAALFRPSWNFLGLVGVLVVSGYMLATSPPDGAARLLIIVFILNGWLVQLCIHEYGHALAGYLGGDHGVAERRALTLDPAAYTDPVMSFGLPLIFLLLGGLPLPGGSVLVNRHRLRSRRWDLAVSAAGPLGTLLMLALVSLPFLLMQDDWVTASNVEFWTALSGLGYVLVIALVLNLLPVPPLDGWNIFSHWMSDETRAWAAGLGYTPLFVLFAMFWLPTPLTFAFWNFVDGLSILVGIPEGWGLYGLDQLTLF